jgi:hypothetical protein
MGRIHLFEFNDQPWVPAPMRDHLTGLLRLLLEVGCHLPGTAEPFLGRLVQGLAAASQPAIVDLCAGAGGPWVPMQPLLSARVGRSVPVLLTDLFPNRRAFARAEARSGGAVSGRAEPWDVTHGAPEVPGLRTMLDAIHHFRPADATAILAAAVRDGEPILTHEVPARHPLQALNMLIILPFMALLATPFLRPFDWRWIPLLPVIIPMEVWDAFVSCLRCHSPAELLAMAGEADPDGAFLWESGALAPLGAGGIWLLGRPRERIAPA